MKSRPVGLVPRKKVGDYIVSTVLKQGSMCQVRTALHVLVNEKVAVKIAAKSALRREKTLETRLQNEAAALRRLQHPGIIALYDVMETENSYYLVEEIAPGCSLAAYLKQHRILPESEARQLTRQLFSAVDHMHRASIIHRDLRLENILVDKTGAIKIIDFGSSHLLDERGCVFERFGPLDYSAPEIVYKEYYTFAVDIWSCGVTLYQLVTGRLPFSFEAEVVLDKYQRAVDRGPSIPSHVSQGCRELILRLLDPNPRSRITMAHVFVQPWVNDGHKSAPLRVLPVATETKLDPTVVQYMTDVLCTDKTEIKTSVSQRKVNGISAIYHLLRKRLNRGDGLPDQEILTKNGTTDIRDTKIRWHNEPEVISARDLYETVDKHYLRERTVTTGQKGTKEIDSVRDQNYKDCLRQLRARSSKPSTAKTDRSRTSMSKPNSSLSRLDSANWLRVDLSPSPVTRTPSGISSPRSGRQSGRLRMSSRNTGVTKVSESLTVQTLNSGTKIHPLDNLQNGVLSVKLYPMSVHKREALRRFRAESEAVEQHLPPPPPNSAMGKRPQHKPDSTVHEPRRHIPVSNSLPRFRKYYDGMGLPRPGQSMTDIRWTPLVPKPAWEPAQNGRMVINVPTASVDDANI